MTANQQIDLYLSVFRAHLRSVTLQEREDLLREIAAHIRDAVEEREGDVTAVLARLGPAAELAAQYQDGLLVQRARHSLSPLLLLRATLRVATRGAFGILVLVCGIFGYAFGAGFVLTGLIKPFAPAHTGVWIDHGAIVSSGALIVVPPSPAHEVLGWWFIPLALMVGSLLIIATTMAIRFCLGLSHMWQARLASYHPSAHGAFTH